jgi:Flp pilus assembly protein TadG
MSQNVIGRIIKDDGGATIVEFALVAPVLLLVVVACLDFARALNAYVTIVNASREGARYATLHPSVDSAAITAAVKSRVVPLDTDPIVMVVDVTFNDGSGSRAWPDTGIPESSPKPKPIAVRVATRYDWVATTWVVGSLFSLTGARTFGSESTMVAIR